MATSPSSAHQSPPLLPLPTARRAESSSSSESRTSAYNTAYRGSEGYIDDADWFADADPRSTESRHATSSSQSQRPAFGSRLLSTLSNAQPAAAALGRKGSVLHSRAKSLAAFVPKLNSSTTSLGERSPSPHKVLSQYFGGESAPIRIGPPLSPTKEKEEDPEFVMEYRSSLTERPRAANSRPQPTSNPSRATSWFTRRSSTIPSSPHIQQQQQRPDELATLHIPSALFPHGPADPLNPHAFNDLLLTATSLLERMQTAYRDKCAALASVQPELDAQREEVEESDTRARHLKLQLEDMSRRAQEQDLAMREMARELTEERMRTLDANVAKTVRMVGEQPRLRRNRSSAASSAQASDSGFESDGDAGSTFFSDDATAATAAAGGSLTSSPTSMPSTLYYETFLQTAKPAVETAAAASSSSSLQRAATVKRLGRDSAVWATVDALRGENGQLKRQVDEMQRSLQACIDLVGGLGGV